MTPLEYLAIYLLVAFGLLAAMQAAQRGIPERWEPILWSLFWPVALVLVLIGILVAAGQDVAKRWRK